MLTGKEQTQWRKNQLPASGVERIITAISTVAGYQWLPLGFAHPALQRAPNDLFWLYLKQASQSSRDCLLSLSFSISKDLPVVLRYCS